MAPVRDGVGHLVKDTASLIPEAGSELQATPGSWASHSSPSGDPGCLPTPSGVIRLLGRRALAPAWAQDAVVAGGLPLAVS